MAIAKKVPQSRNKEAEQLDALEHKLTNMYLSEEVCSNETKLRGCMLELIGIVRNVNNNLDSLDRSLGEKIKSSVRYEVKPDE